MTIALIAPESVPLPEIGDDLKREGIRVACFILNQELNRNCIGDTVEKAVLISPERGVVDVGEQVECVREIIGPQRRLILCALHPGVADRPTLIECGASVIIGPQSWAAGHIATRVLGQLILDEALKPNGLGLLRGATRQMRNLYEHIQKLAPISENILILGERGTGKELVAREIHEFSNLSGAYKTINCATIDPALMVNELFGHKRGGFTGADRDQDGLIASAGEGTVFFDEIGDLNLQAQAQLLRVLEYREVKRVGSNEIENIKARMVFATNSNLEAACNENKFRRELLDRIDGFTLELPPLRERKADIPLLVNHFVERHNAKYNACLKVPQEGIDCLFRYNWPGNVRELLKIIKKAAVYADASHDISNIILRELVRKQDVKTSHSFIPFDPSVDGWRSVISRAESVYFNALLVYTDGNREEAKRLSGLSRSQFFEKLKKLKKMD